LVINFNNSNKAYHYK